MGLFGRLFGMGKAKANAVLDDMENPMELYDQKLRDMDEALNKAKLSSATVLGSCTETKKKLDEKKQESLEWDSKVKKAMSAGNEELAKKALAKKLEADKSVVVLENTYNSQNKQAAALKANLRKLEENIESMRNQRGEFEARLANAEAAGEVSKIISDIQSHGSDINLDSIERKIEKKEKEAAGFGELASMKSASEELDDEFKKLDEVDLDVELAKYKQDK